MMRTVGSDGVRVAVSVASVLGVLLLVPTHARAQPAPQALGFTARLYTTDVTWQSEPGTQVAAELRDSAGVRARADAIVRSDGNVTLRFQPARLASDSVVRPGDLIAILPEGLTPIIESVPELYADVSSDRRHVLGRAPPGARIEWLLVRDGALRPNGGLDVEPDGRLDLPIEPSEWEGRGFLTLTTGAGNVFWAPLAAFGADIELGARSVAGEASAGAIVSGTVQSASGSLRHDLAAREVLGDRSWHEDLPLPLAVDAGAVITLTRASRALDAPASITKHVPVLTVAASSGEVHGNGPPNTDLVVAVRPPSAAETSYPVRTDAEGRYALVVDAERDIVAGWRIRTTLNAGDNVHFWVDVPFYPIDVTLFTGKVTGVIDMPGAEVRVVLKDADGTVRASGAVRAQGQASQSRPAGFFLFAFADQRIRPGDTLELDWRRGDPIIVAIPQFTARVDAAANIVSGEAPPGSRMEIATLESVEDGPRALANLMMVEADPAGQYRADFSARHNIAAGEQGHVALLMSQGYRILSAWSGLALKWQAGVGLTGNALPGRALQVSLRAPDGRVLGRHTDPGLPTGGWHAAIRDSAGDVVEAAVDDRYEVVMGDQTTTLTIPELQASLFVAEDRLIGRTLPNTRVGLFVANLSGGRDLAQETSDARGYFEHDYSTTYDIQYNDRVSLGIDVAGGHRIERWTFSPGLTIDLDTAVVSGSQQPERAIDAELVRDGRVVADGRAQTDAAGVFALTLLSQAGSSGAPNPSDTLIVRTEQVEAVPEMTLTVPDFALRLDAAQRTVSGQALSGGWLSFMASPTFRRALGLGDGSLPTDASIAPDGTYRLAFDPPSQGGPDFRAGQQFAGRLVLPSGHVATRTRFVPIANVQHGGAHVCGYSAPGDAVTSSVEWHGVIVARAHGTATGDGWFDLVVRDVDGRPVRAEAGQTVAITLGTQSISMTLPVLQIATRWHDVPANQSAAQTVITGTGPAASDYYITHPADGCFAGHDQDTQLDGVTSNAGAFRRTTVEVPPGTTMEVAFFAKNGHRYYRRVDRPKLQIYVHTRRAAGTAAPFAALTLQLRDPNGTLKGRVGVVADEEGRFSTQFGDDERSVAEPGDVVELATPSDASEAGGDDWIERILVEGLTFDFGDTVGLLGQAPANRRVAVLMTLREGRTLAFELAVDLRGRFAYGPADVPPRANWDMADVSSIQVALTTAGGHEILADGSVANPPVPLGLLFIPFTLRR